MDRARVHLTFLWNEAALPEIAALRHRWDPAMAAGVPPHVTLVYPEEYDDRDLLIARAHEVCPGFPRFSLGCGPVVVDGDDGAGGVFVTMADPADSWRTLRSRLLQPPFEPLTIEPHLTIVHPRTSDLGPIAWRELADWRSERLVAPTEVALTRTAPDTGLEVLERFPLAGRERPLCAAVLLVEDGRVLLGKRAADRSWFPGVWDLIGGHVEAGESIATAAVRELAEEVGVVVDADRLHHLHTVVAPEYELVVFDADRWSGAARNLASHEHDEIGWFDADQVVALELADPAIAELTSIAVARSR